MWPRQEPMRGRGLYPRGRGRGRGSGGGFGTTRNSDTPQRPPSPPIGDLIDELRGFDVFTAAQAGNNNDETVGITDCKYVASYNWLDREDPTILVPGAPPAWTPLTEPRKLKEDDGNYFRDPNAARSPTYPMEPAVRALLTKNQSLETQAIDLVACSSTLGNLLRFARRIEHSFRFFVEVVGNTVFFIRHENLPNELIVGVRGYGHTFPEAYTTWDGDVKGSASHQRLVRYKLAGLDCVLRFKSDGYLPSKIPTGSRKPSAGTDKQSGADDDNFTSMLDSLKVNSSIKQGGGPTGPLQIEEAGQEVPQAAVFNLKTRSIWKKGLDVLGDELPCQWTAQIPNFILARHNNGVFNEISVQDVQENVMKWEQENQRDIKRLGWLLRKVIAAAKMRKDGKLEVRCKSLDSLELREQDSDENNVLPLELVLRWMHGESSEATGSVKDQASETEDSQELDDESSYLQYPVGGDDTGYDSSLHSDEKSEKDYTACSADDCGYCGHCSY